MSQNVNINLVPGNYPKEFHVSQYDVGRQLVANIVDSTGAYSIPSGATVTLVGTKPSGFGFTLNGSVGSGGVVTFSTTAAVTAEYGRIPCEIRITSGDTVLGTANLMLIVEESPHQEGVIDGNSEAVIPELTILVERVEAAASNVLDMQVEADTLPAGSSATYSYNEETNTATFGIPQGEAGAGAAGVVASAYSASSTYAVGDYVIHDGNLYRCTTAITTAEAFTAAHWTQVVLGDDVSDLKSDINGQKENPPLFSKLRNAEVYGNLWDEDTKAYGCFDTTVTNLGHLIEGGTAWTYSPTYIPVNESDIILYNNSRPIICAYDKDGNVVSCSQPSWSGYTVPSGVAYLRFAVTSASSNGMYIFKDGTSQFEYKSKTKLYLPSLMTEKPIITVDIAGAGDYRSLTEALYDTFEESPDVFVYQGTYDIVAEYKALFGNDIFDNMTYQTEGMKGFQWGLYIDNRTVTFASGAKVVSDLSAYTNDGTRRFSPFNLVRNAVIDGCYCYAVNPYYIVHDDFGLDTDIAFTNIIKNCVLISPEPAQGNVIGGGLKKYATKIVDNCYLDNGNNRPVTMRYHNTNYPNATPTVIIKNTRANGIIRVNCYGTQTTKMIAIINNCKANAIEKAYEGSASVDNIDLYDWCNETNS